MTESGRVRARPVRARLVSACARRRRSCSNASIGFYDWEPNVMGPGCEADPRNPRVTGGLQAGTARAIPEYEAVRRAARCPARHAKIATTNGSWYVLDDRSHQVLAGPLDSAAAARAMAGDPRPDGTTVVEVKPGTILVRAELPDTATTKPDRWFVLRDRPALHGSDLVDPEQDFDQAPGGGGQPVVAFDFTSKGRRLWQRVTRRIAHRGQARETPGQEPLAVAQHFAIVLDNELISVPYIDHRKNPDGIDARKGSQIQGGFTIRSARNLAALLASGVLPVRLTLASVDELPPGPGG